MLWKQEASQTSLLLIVQTQLQIKYRSALVSSDPNSCELGEVSEGVGEVVEVVANDV